MDFLSASRFLDATRGRHIAATGQYRRFVNATPGSGILLNAATSFSATAASVIIQNTAPASSNVFLFPDFLKLIVTVASTESGAGALNYVGALDTKLRYSSGGTQVVTPGTLANNNGPASAHPDFLQQKAYQSQAAVFVGALVANAESGAATRIERGQFKTAAATPLCVVGDEYTLTFGPGEDVGAGFSKIGTTSSIYRQNAGIVGIGPQGSLVIHTFCPNQTTGVTVELAGGIWELSAYPA